MRVGGHFSRSKTIPPTPASVAGPESGLRAKIPVGLGEEDSGAKSEPRDRASSISPSVSASCPLPAPRLIFFFFFCPLSFNLISSNSTFVVNRRHARTSQSPPRNQLVKKARPALGKQAAGTARPNPTPRPPPGGGGGEPRGEPCTPASPPEPQQGSLLVDFRSPPS